MQIKQGDFVEIEYTGKLKEKSEIFDTTDEVVAKANNIYSPKMRYGPVIICIGERNVLAGLDSHLEGKEVNKTYSIELQPEEGFGRKNPKMIQLINTQKFIQQKIRPFPGLQINIDGMLGTIKTVTGGRTLVDFNHPLSGKEIVYDVKLNRIIIDNKEKIKSILFMNLNITDADIEVEDSKTKIRLKHELPEQVRDKLKEDIQRLVKIKEVEFTEIEETKKEIKKD